MDEGETEGETDAKGKSGSGHDLGTDGPDAEEVVEGMLGPRAASVLMKCMYAARMCRIDLLRPVQGLARYLQKWGKRQDEELYKMMCYIDTTKHHVTLGWVGDKLTDIKAHLCKTQRQGCVSQSTAESELVSAAMNVRTMRLPILTILILWNPDAKLEPVKTETRPKR